MSVWLLKDPAFDRRARRAAVTDAMLRLAAEEIEQGLVDASRSEWHAQEKANVVAIERS